MERALLTVQTEVTFHDVASELGLTFVHQAGPAAGFPMPEIMSGGAAVFDADGDGFLDIYLVNAGDQPPAPGARGGGAPNRLYRQDPETGRFVDVTDEAGVGDRGYGMGVAVGDYDNDGDVDLFVANYGTDALYRNEGAGRFTEVGSSLGVADEGWSSSAVFFDADADGDLDLFVVRYVAFDLERRCRHEGGRPDYCGPTVFAGVDDLFYRNEGGTGFVEVSLEAGLRGVEDAGLGVLARDFDHDGDIDLYVANDGDPNNLWINQGDGTFVDEGVFRGVAFNRFGAGEAGMGVTAGDADDDGDDEIFVTHLIEETNTYYEDLGGAVFADGTAAAALGLPSLDLTGFGVAFLDYDNDGDLDLAVANGATKRRPARLVDRRLSHWSDYAEPGLLLANDGRGRFSIADRAGGDLVSDVEVSRALVPVDFDADGDLDLLVTTLGGPVRLYRNDGGNRGNWVSLEVIETELRRLALGATVSIQTTERTIRRDVASVGSYLSAGPGLIHIGLRPQEGIVEFRVRWLDGSSESFRGSETRRHMLLQKGSGEVVGERP